MTITNLRHGHAGHSNGNKPSREWRSWHAMHQRCKNPSPHNRKYYAERGIRVCERWDVFENFLADMGPRPPGTTLDRFPDQAGNYEPGNCRWATPKEQAANRRKPTLPTVRVNNTSGRVGVYPHKGFWRVELRGKRIGQYRVLEDAVAAREAAEAAL